jgi:two-component system chemotaxis response regulator CheB
MATPPSAAVPRITAMVVDDSAVVRKHLADLLQAGGIEVIATASDPLFAWPKMAARWPDVVVLDVEMPRMDGISFLRKIMAERPTPVVMCSTLTEKGATTTLQALSEGAVSFVTKPKLGLREFLSDPSNGLVASVRAAAASNLRAMRPRAGHSGSGSGAANPRPGRQAAGQRGCHGETTDRVVAIGSSTGGVQAIEALLTALPRTTPGMVIVQHMPERFTAALRRAAEQPVRDGGEGGCRRRPRGRPAAC